MNYSWVYKSKVNSYNFLLALQANERGKTSEREEDDDLLGLHLFTRLSKIARRSHGASRRVSSRNESRKFDRMPLVFSFQTPKPFEGENKSVYTVLPVARERLTFVSPRRKPFYVCRFKPVPQRALRNFDNFFLARKLYPSHYGPAGSAVLQLYLNNFPCWYSAFDRAYRFSNEPCPRCRRAIP